MAVLTDEELEVEDQELETEVESDVQEPQPMMKRQSSM